MRLLCVCRHTNINLSNSPHPTGNWSWKSCACLFPTARKMMRLLCLCVHRNMNVIIPPHPPTHPTGNWSWKSSACKCSTARKMMRLLCVCRHRNMNLINSPHPTGNWSWKSCACLCSTGRKMMRLLCLCVHRNMNVIIPPHPPHPPQPNPKWLVPSLNVRGWPLFVRGWRGFSVRRWLVCNVRRWLAFNVRRWRVDPLIGAVTKNIKSACLQKNRTRYGNRAPFVDECPKGKPYGFSGSIFLFSPGYLYQIYGLSSSILGIREK